MPRIRTIKPEFWEDETAGRWSANCRLLFLCGLNYADDYGVVRGDAAFIRSRAFAYTDVTLDEVRRALDECSASLRPFVNGGETFRYYVHWDEHQRVDRPSKVRNPGPPGQDPDSTWVSESSTSPRRALEEPSSPDLDLDHDQDLVSSPNGDSSAVGQATTDRARKKDNSVLVVYGYWRETTASAKGNSRAIGARRRSRINDTAKRYISGRLRSFSPEELCQAVDGALVHPDYNGSNGNPVYDGIDNIFCNDERVRKLIEASIDPPQPRLRIAETRKHPASWAGDPSEFE